VSELEIALLFLLCVASFAAFLFALSPRLYCEAAPVAPQRYMELGVRVCVS